MMLMVLMVCALFVVSCTQEIKVNDNDVLDDVNVPVDSQVQQPNAEIASDSQVLVDTGSVNVELDVVQTPEVVVDNQPNAGTIHEVSFTDKGLIPRTLTIKAGDTVKWINARPRTKALLLGVQACNSIKSLMLNPGEEFSYQFNEPLRCEFIDGVFVETSMVLKVE